MRRLKEGNYLDTQEDIPESHRRKSGFEEAESNTPGADNQVKAIPLGNGYITIKEDIRAATSSMIAESHVRPIIAIISIIALCFFYTLTATGSGSPPAEINSLWIPVLWFFRDRTLLHKKQGDL